MSKQIKETLKNKLENIPDYYESDAKTRRNILKEELQLYILDFIYNRPECNKWVMYGGSAIRIIHNLDRLSVDLDFEVEDAVTEKFLEELKTKIEDHFTNRYNTDADFLKIKPKKHGLTLKFCVGKLIDGHASEWIDITIDLNYFIAPKTVVREYRTINENQFSFTVATYNKSALMASKIAAIFLRKPRGVDKNIYDYKGRDIYDLLWYMSKKITPDFDYLNAKLKERNMEIPNIKTLFDKLTADVLNYEKMDSCLKEDLSYLFGNPRHFKNWFDNWRENYLRLLDDYKIRAITKLSHIIIYHDLNIDNYSFIFLYDTEDGKTIRVTYTMEEYWIILAEGDLLIEIDKNLENKIEFSSNGYSSRKDPENKLKQYAALFYHKTEEYFKKTNRIMVGDSIITKVIRMTAKNLNPKEQILLTKSALISHNVELDDLLK